MSNTRRARDGAAFLLRIDCEHTEALRWAGSSAIEATGIERLLDLLAARYVPATFAFVGATATEFPSLARAARDRGHAIAGHSLRHCRAYAGQVEAWQWRDMREMIDAIDGACGVRVHGLAAPCHGAIDQITLRAAAMAGLRYVLNTTLTVEGTSGFGAAFGGPSTVLVPPASMRVLWDWTSLQPDWPPFGHSQARSEWVAAIDAAALRGELVSLIVHPWIVETNDEYALLADVLEHVRASGLPMTTFDQLVQAEGYAPATVAS